MNKIIIWCQDIIGKKMAGCAIRYWELAKTLSKDHEVVLFAPNGSDAFQAPFKVLRGTYRNLYKELKSATAILTQEIKPIMAFVAKINKVRFILDAYDPMVLEHLEIFKDFQPRYRNYKHEVITNSQLFSFRMADFVVCANERQRDLWIGVMLGLNLITPAHYAEDCKLRHLIDVVSFGLSAEAPQKSGAGLREKYGLKSSDKVLLWGGGIWNWFDPLTLIQALKEVLKDRNDVYLIFMGLKHPNPQVPEMQMSRDAIALADKLGLLNTHIFFNYGWTPYEERQNFLLDADIGVSTHLDHLETRFSFRTRILDYIWAGLPILSSEGDYFAELNEKKDLGEVVKCQDVDGAAKAIVKLLDAPERLGKIRKNLSLLQTEFYWEKMAEPIKHALKRFSPKRKVAIPFAMKKDMFRMFLKTKGPEKVLKKLISLTGGVSKNLH